MIRKIIISLLGVALIGASYFAAKSMANSKKKHGFHGKKEVKAVYVTEVNNTSIPVQITTSGQLEAKEKVQLFSEVQGIMKRGSKRFFEGTYFRKGEVILSINSEEFNAGLKAQKSSLYNQIISIMPDLKLDFPEASQNWENYLSNFDINKSLPPLPQALSEQEKYYIAGKQINTSYYNIKNQEVRLRKHAIRAPFNGYVTEAMVKEGTLIRQGQKLGEFISPSVYELKVPINAKLEQYLKIGKKVKTYNIDKTKSWVGTISRINRVVDTKTQSVLAFIDLKGEDLRDGMFLEADLDAKQIDESYEISRKLINDDNSIFIVRDTVLESIFIDPVYYNESSVIVKNIPEGSKILSKPVPGAYPGMIVEVLSK